MDIYYMYMNREIYIHTLLEYCNFEIYNPNHTTNFRKQPDHENYRFVL